MSFEVRGPWVIVLLLCMGILFMGVSIFSYRNEEAKKDRCTERAIATVVDYVDGYTEEGSIVYYPVFEFYADGHTYTVQHNTGTNPPRFRYDEQVRINYNAENPWEFVVPGDNFAFIICLVFFIIGVILTAIAMGLATRLLFHGY